MSLRLFLSMVFGFMLFTVIGTQTHELGHIAVARFLGYETKLSYGSMSYSKEELYKEHDQFLELYENEIIEKSDFPNQARFHELEEELTRDKLWITLGGPIQTMLMGMIGLILLIRFRQNRHQLDFDVKDWIATFLSLFWLREVFNLCLATLLWLFYGKTWFRGDEFKIAHLLDLPYWSVMIVLGITGLLISLFVIFKIMPKRYWISFNLAGIIGGLSGFYLWFQVLGPFLFQE